MQICTNYSSNTFSSIFIFIEYILIILLLLLFLKKIYDLYKYHNNSFDKIDTIIIYLSSLQLILFIIRLIINYSIFSTLISINKFSQNFLICVFLLIYILNQDEKSKATIVKYFLVVLIILDILIFLIEISYGQILEKNNKETLVDLIISIICLIFDGFIWYKSFINKKIMNSKITEKNGPNKLSNIINKDEILIVEQKDENDENDDNKEENGFIDDLYYQNLNNVVILITTYFYILFAFIISYLIDFIFYFSNNSSINTKDINNNNTTTGHNDTMTYNTTIEYNNTEVNNVCIFSQNIEEQFTISKLIVCFIIFFFRDIVPYLVIYLMFFYYKLNYYHRASF